MPSSTEQKNGIAHLESRYSVEQTLARLESAVNEHGLRIFARIDHSGAAAQAGLKLRPTQVLIFGNPRGGTPLMLAAPSVAIDLPFKALVWEDDSQKVWVTYNAPEYLENRHGVPASLAGKLNSLVKLLQNVVK